MSSERKAPSNLEMLQADGVIPENMTMDEAAEELTDILNCVECIAYEQCSEDFIKKEDK